MHASVQVLKKSIAKSATSERIGLFFDGPLVSHGFWLRNWLADFGRQPTLCGGK
jgi:hypothetical protein